MQVLRIQKSIDIAAPALRVWDVLTDNEANRAWLDCFNPGNMTAVDSDWKQGSRAVFLDKEKSGMAFDVTQSQPGTLLELTISAWVENGQERSTGPDVEPWLGIKEIYRMAEQGGRTHLGIETMMGDEYYDTMAAAWDEALTKIKQIAEKA